MRTLIRARAIMGHVELLYDGTRYYAQNCAGRLLCRYVEVSREDVAICGYFRVFRGRVGSAKN